MIYVAPHQDHVRLGVDACPGADERARVLHLQPAHDDSCCAEWNAGLASTPTRAEEFRRVAARSGSTWPKITPEVADPEPEAEAGR